MKSSNNLLFASILCAASIVLGARTGHAVCSITSGHVSTADCNLWTAWSTDSPSVSCSSGGGNGGWSSAWTNWFDVAYALTTSQWAARGYASNQDIRREYTKFWHTGRMINDMNFGPRDQSAWVGISPITPSYHDPTADYQAASESWNNNFHLDFDYVAADATCGAACYTGGGTKTITTSCFMFNSLPANGAFNTPIARASVMLHEAWHSWQQKAGYSQAH